MTEKEEYFPRGGSKAHITQFKKSINFLGAPEKGDKKKKRTKKQLDPDDDGYLSDEARKESDRSLLNCAIGLSYSTVRPGLTILGRVKRVYETCVLISLPCKLQGIVMACHISEPYNKLLEAYVNDKIEKVHDLPSMFKLGQYVAVSVLEVDGDKLMLSMMPQHVYANHIHSDLKKGYIFQAAVSSVEDHGYVIDIGISGTRAFLPNTNVDEGVKLESGMLTWCSIKNVDASPETSIVTLNAALEAVSRARVKHKPRNNGVLPPATMLEFNIEKSLDNGIEGVVFGNMTAYVQRYHAGKVKGKKPGYGQKVQARVLYVMPVRDTPFLTMQDVFSTDIEAEQTLKDGDIIDDAQVIRITGRSVHFRLRGGSAATLSTRRLPVHEDLDDEQLVAKSYPIGSTHKVRILTYNMSDFLYSVSDEPSIVNERYFSIAQLSVGELVPATVTEVTDGHLLLNIGRVKGFVPHAHMTETGIFSDPKKANTRKMSKKYKVGQTVKGRILSIDHQKSSVIVTLKTSLLNPDIEVLKSYEEAEVGKAYTGVIKHIRDYVLVSFFGGVTAFVRREYVTRDVDSDIAQAYHVGQIVNCTILAVKPEVKKMSGSLTTTPFWPEKKRDLTEKRKNRTEEDVVPNKKRKDTQTATSTKPKQTEVEDKNSKKDSKKKKKTSTSEDDVSETDNKKERKRKHEMKVKDKKQESEESDAIETDIYDDTDQLLTPEDLLLIDLSDCDTAKQYKKRVVALLKAVKNKTMKIERIDHKIDAIEEKGLNPHNQMYHTAMRADKLVLEERTKKLLEVLDIAQNKLKELGIHKNEDYKEAQKSKKNKKGNAKEDSNEDKVQKKVDKKLEKKKGKPNVAVVENLEPVLDVPSAKDFWSGDVGSAVKKLEDEEPSSSDEEEQDQPRKKRKKLTVAEKLSRAREEESRLRELERRALDAETQPRSSDQFERALLANPDCSQLWIAYMAFHLQSTELDKCRSVCRRALDTISFRAEHERRNVCLALINAEHRFGTKETQQKALEEALQTNDTYQIHSKLLDILVDTGKTQELASLVDLMMRKYRRESSMYLACGGACYKAGLVDKARQVMQKAMTALEKKEHVTLLVQFALLERTFGAVERCEALFEQLVAVYPQRVDACAAYVDALVRSRDVDRARQVLERMTSQKLPARKMKVLYRKWIEVEEKLGDPEQVEKVRQKAVAFIDKAQF